MAMSASIFRSSVNALLIQKVNEAGVSKSLGTNCGIDTGDPKRTVFAFLKLTADITVRKTLFQHIFGNCIYILTFAVKSFGFFENPFFAGPGCDRID